MPDDLTKKISENDDEEILDNMNTKEQDQKSINHEVEEDKKNTDKPKENDTLGIP